MGHSAIHYRPGFGWPAGLLIAMLVLVDGLGVGTAVADEEQGGRAGSLFDKRFLVALGGFFPAIESSISLGPSGGGSSGDIDLQDDLGIERFSPSLWVGMMWRFLPRHQIQLEWFRLNQDGNVNQAFNPPLSFGDLTILNAGVSTELDLNLGRITYGYSILRDEKSDLSFLVGAHIATAKATMTASGLISVGGALPAMGTFTESSSTITLPLPHLGAQYSYEFGPRWALQVRAMAFALQIGDYRGSLIEIDGTAAYQLSRNFGIGAGIKYFNLNVERTATRVADFEYEFLGPTIFGYANF